MISVANSDYHSFSIPLTVDINSGDNWERFINLMHCPNKNNLVFLR